MLKFVIWIMPSISSRIVCSLCLGSLLLLPSLLTAETPAGNVVTINSDNVLLINGRKVFPIGFTTAAPPRPTPKLPMAKTASRNSPMPA